MRPTAPSAGVLASRPREGGERKVVDSPHSPWPGDIRPAPAHDFAAFGGGRSRRVECRTEPLVPEDGRTCPVAAIPLRTPNLPLSQSLGAAHSGAATSSTAPEDSHPLYIPTLQPWWSPSSAAAQARLFPSPSFSPLDCARSSPLLFPQCPFSCISRTTGNPTCNGTPTAPQYACE